MPTSSTSVSLRRDRRLIEYLDHHAGRRGASCASRPRRGCRSRTFRRPRRAHPSREYSSRTSSSQRLPYACEFCDIPASTAHPRLKTAEQIVASSTSSRRRCHVGLFRGRQLHRQTEGGDWSSCPLVAGRRRTSSAALRVRGDAQHREERARARADAGRRVITVFCGIERRSRPSIHVKTQSRMPILEAVRRINDHGPRSCRASSSGSTPTRTDRRAHPEFIRESRIPLLTINIRTRSQDAALAAAGGRRTAASDVGRQSNVEFDPDDRVVGMCGSASRGLRAGGRLCAVRLQMHHTCHAAASVSDEPQRLWRSAHGFGILGRVLWKSGWRRTYRRTFWRSRGRISRPDGSRRSSTWPSSPPPDRVHPDCSVDRSRVHAPQAPLRRRRPQRPPPSRGDIISTLPHRCAPEVVVALRRTRRGGTFLRWKKFAHYSIATAQSSP